MYSLQFTNCSTQHKVYPRLLEIAGLGVHLTLAISRSFALLPSQPAFLFIASALRELATPDVVLSNSLRAAGVSEPEASALRGVNEGGGISPPREA